MRWHKRSSGARLRVAGGTLTVTRGAGGRAFAEVTLEDLLEVKIDTEALRNLVVVRASPGFGDAAHAPGESFESRLALFVRGQAEPVYLTEERRSMSETTEELGRVRRFLRAEGWLPLEERGDAAPPSSQGAPRSR